MHAAVNNKQPNIYCYPFEEIEPNVEIKIFSPETEWQDYIAKISSKSLDGSKVVKYRKAYSKIRGNDGRSQPYSDSKIKFEFEANYGAFDISEISGNLDASFNSQRGVYQLDSFKLDQLVYSEGSLDCRTVSYTHLTLPTKA